MEDNNNTNLREYNDESGRFLPEEEINISFEDTHETWGNRVQYVLANIGFTVGIGTIWRFPILFVRNGGGAFLIPFVIVLVVIGGPLYHLEVNLGQFTGRAPLKAFEYCPLFKGTGFLMVSMLCIVMWYNISVMCWILYFLYSSFSSTLPWASCGNSWNTDKCRSAEERSENMTLMRTAGNATVSAFTPASPALEFWLNNVLGKSSGLEDLGRVQPHLVVCLIVAWTITTLCIIKGVKSVGKVVYVTVLLPYVLMTILLIRAVTLDGSLDGIVFCLDMKLEKLADLQVWLDASIQAFYSLGPIWGTVITMASHNKFTQPNFRDTVTICVVDTISTIYAAIVVFSILGFMAKKEGIPLEELASASGPGLAFVAYPTAVTYLPLPQLWAVLFFVMLLLVMLDSAFAMVEAIRDGILDVLPKRYKRYPAVVTIGFAVFMFLCSLIYTTQGGVYLFQLIDWYSTTFAMLVGAFMEVTSITLIYGVDRFSNDISLMGGQNISKIARILYCIVIPIITLVTFVVMLVQYREPYYGDGYIYSPYAVVAGICVGLIPVFVVLAVAIWTVATQKESSFSKKLKRSLQPSDKWMPQDKPVSEIYKTKPYTYSGSVLDRFKTNLFGSEDTRWF